MAQTTSLSARPIQLSELASWLKSQSPQLALEVHGECTFQGIQSPSRATAQDLAFLSTPKALKEGLNSQAQCFVVHRKFAERLMAERPDASFIVSAEPERAMAISIHHFIRATPPIPQRRAGIHPTAVVDPSAEIHPTAEVGPYCVIEAQVKIAEGATLRSHVHVDAHTEIGAHTVIFPFTFIGPHTTIGANCEIHCTNIIGKEGFGYAHDAQFNHYRIPHQGRVIIGNKVHLGAGTTVDRGTFEDTVINDGVIFDNQAHIGHNCSVGKNTVAAKGFGMSGSSKIGANCLVGGGVALSNQVEVVDGVQVGALSAIYRDIEVVGAYAGNPLLPLKDHLRMKSALTRLPEIMKRLKIKDPESET
jgi:UDP-3-O-[3-hydroxymyristoyl] glucosamine N-acyltransferase